MALRAKKDNLHGLDISVSYFFKVLVKNVMLELQILVRPKPEQPDRFLRPCSDRALRNPPCSNVTYLKNGLWASAPKFAFAW